MLSSIAKRNINTTFEAPLTSSIIPYRAGAPIPTFSRSVQATVIDFEGVLKTAKMGEARFNGTRRVENLLTYSEFPNGAADAPAKSAGITTGSMVGYSGAVTFPTASQLDYAYKSYTTIPGRTYILSAVVQMADNSLPRGGNLSTSPTTDVVAVIGGSTSSCTYIGYESLGSNRYRLFWSRTIPMGSGQLALANNGVIRYAANSGKGFTVTAYMLEDVTNQTNQNPSEYIPTSSAISLSDTIVGSEKVVNGGFDTDTVWTKGAGVTIASGVASFNNLSLSASLYQGLSMVAGKVYVYTFTITSYTAGTIKVFSAGTTPRSAVGTYTEVYVHTGSTNFSFDCNGFTGSIDNVSCKEVLHGSGVDGVQYFEYLNGNTVSNGIVTEAKGAMISGVELNANVGFNSDLSGWTTGANSTATWNNGVAHCTFAGQIPSTGGNWFYMSPYSLKRYVVYKITFDAKYISGGDLQAGLSYDSWLTVTAASNGGITKTYSFTAVCDPYSKCVSGQYAPTFGSSVSNTVWELDNISVKQVLPGYLAELATQNKCTNYNIIPADTLGSELVPDTGFSTPSSWAVTANTNVSGGVGIFTAATLSDYIAANPSSAVKGKIYQITYTINSISGGNIACRFGSITGTSRSSVGTYTENIGPCTSTAVASIYVTSGTPTAQIDNMSVKEVVFGVGTKAYYDGSSWQNPIPNMVISGDTAAVLSIVDESTNLSNAKLLNISQSGKVYKLDNSAGTTTASVLVQGATGNTNTHQFSCFVKGTGTGRITYSNTGGNGYISWPTIYSRLSSTLATANTIDKFDIEAQAGGIVYFILNQLEDSVFVTSPIIVQGAAITRNIDSLTYQLTGNGTLNNFACSIQTMQTGVNTAVWPAYFSFYYDSNNRYEIIQNAAVGVAVAKRIAGVQPVTGGAVSISGGVVPNAVYKLSAKQSSSTGFTVCCNNVKGSVGNDATALASIPSSITQVSIARSGTCGYFKNAKIWNRPLDDADLTKATI